MASLNLPFRNQQSDLYFDLHHREIRLITLHHGQWADEIRCSLFHAHLSNKPVYKALSYVWGPPRITHPILLNGTHHQVTVNLETALRRLRQPTKDLTLWVDALCIHQSNYAERTQQVNLMRDIFSSTEEVLVYLGEVPTHDSVESASQNGCAPTTVFSNNDGDEEHLEVFRSHCMTKGPITKSKSKVKINYAFDVFCLIRYLANGQSLETIPPFDNISQKSISKRYERSLFEGLRYLMLCRWWNRIWVIQEVVVPLHISVVYGSSIAPWKMFVDAALSYSRLNLATFFFPNEFKSVVSWFSRSVLDLFRMQELWLHNQEMTILPLLKRFSGRKATDDRDKIYALLTLVSDKSLRIVPDYSLPIAQVFQNTALSIIANTKSLHVLAGDIGRKDRQDLPSWCPDWSAPYDDFDRRRADRSVIYNASCGSIIIKPKHGEPDWKGEIQQLLHLSPTAANKRLLLNLSKIHTKEELWHILNLKNISDIFRTSDWTHPIPSGILNLMPDAESSSRAIENFLASRFQMGILRNHSDGVLSLPGLCIDKILITGDIAYSDNDPWSVVYSWAVQVVNHFTVLREPPLLPVLSKGVGEAFRRTICADVVASNSIVQRIGKDMDGHNKIAAWCWDNIITSRLHKNGHRGQLPENTLMTLFDDLSKTNYVRQPGEYASHISRYATEDIDAAINSASVRRTFFITTKGHMGLGPPKTKVGDSLAILMGGQTPFILREAGTRYFQQGLKWQLRHERTVFEVIGDCYTDGFMDGEISREVKPDLRVNQNAYSLEKITNHRLVVGKNDLRRSMDDTDNAEDAKETPAKDIKYVRDYTDFKDGEFPYFYLV